MTPRTLHCLIHRTITMKDQLINYFSRITPLSEEEALALKESITIKKLKEGAYLLKEAQISDSTYFVLKGCVREFVVLNGEEQTTNFFTEDQWIISTNDLLGKSPSNINLVCTEETHLVVGNEKKAMELFRQFPRFEFISRTIMEAALAEQGKMIRSFQTDSPDERYQKLLKSRPDLLQRVPQYQLASYLGVKPESLSRIRKRMTQKK